MDVARRTQWPGLCATDFRMGILSKGRPTVCTYIWFIYGNQNIDPMYPGVITSVILCFLNKKSTS